MTRAVSTWFVTYMPMEPLSGQRIRRTSKQFITEQAAKKFARVRLADSSEITAGSINPHLPKRFIGTAHIAGWVKEP